MQRTQLGGEEAIQLLTQTPHARDTDFAVVLMDHQLPGIDGLEATRHLLAAIAAAAGEPETLRRAAHTLTSSARLVGALELAAACRLLERGDGASATIDRIAVEAADALRRWLAAADAR